MLDGDGDAVDLSQTASRQHVRWRAGRDQTSVTHQGDARCNGEGVIRIVCRKHDTNAWRGWSRALSMSFNGFAKNFANTLPADAQKAAYDAHIVPAPGRIYYQSVLGFGAGVNWKNPKRAPLLLVSATEDRTVEPGMVRQNAKKYAKSSARTDLKIVERKSHYLIAEAGWEALADEVLQWANDSSNGAA